MFGTLRYNAQDDNTQFVQRVTNPLETDAYGEGLRYSACDKCRSKKQRCGGQQGGCDRCKRNSYTCVYSLQGKGKGNRQRRDPEGKHVRPTDSSLPSPAATRLSTGVHDPENANQETSTRTTLLAQHLSATHSVEGSQDSNNSAFSPIGSFDDDFFVSDQMVDDILPDFDGQSTDTYLGSSALSSKDDMEFDDYFANGSIGSSPMDHLQPVSPVTGQQDHNGKISGFNLNTHLSQAPVSSNFETTGNARVTSQATVTSPPQTPTKDSADHQTDSASKYHCLNTISLLLEGRAQLPNSSVKLDLILASQKETLARCHSVLSCSTCLPRPEYILLLGMVTERLVSLYECIIDRYLVCVSSAQLTFRHGAATVVAAANGPSHYRNSSSSGEGKVFLGSYEIDTPDEYNGLMRLLIVIQLRSLWKFMTGMKRAAESGAFVTPKAYALEKRAMRLIRKIRHLRG